MKELTEKELELAKKCVEAVLNTLTKVDIKSPDELDDLWVRLDEIIDEKHWARFRK